MVWNLLIDAVNGIMTFVVETQFVLVVQVNFSTARTSAILEFKMATNGILNKMTGNYPNSAENHIEEWLFYIDVLVFECIGILNHLNSVP